MNLKEARLAMQASCPQGGGEILAQDGRCCTVKLGRPLKIRRFRQTQNIFLCRFSGFSRLHQSKAFSVGKSAA
jgi:hypothetical protein